MRFEVPQFIEVEDKIVGPLTWRQFVYLAGGGGILIVCYMTLPFIFFTMIGLPLAALASSLAFHRVNNRPFSIFLESMVNYFAKNKLYLWKKDTEQSIVTKSEPISSAQNLSYVNKNAINSLSRKLELHLSNE